MRFSLIDRIVELQPGTRITAQKNLALAEDYLADHFPRAPVMPGVLMLEALVQASGWLVRASEGFVHSVVLLKEVRSVKYANFVEPGQSLQLTAELLDQDERLTKLKGQGTVDGVVCVAARLVLERYNLAAEDPARSAVDAFILQKMRELFTLLNKSEMSPAAPLTR